MHLQNHYPVLSCMFGCKILVWSCHILVEPEWPRALKCLCVPWQCYQGLQQCSLAAVPWVHAGVGSAGVPQDCCCAQVLASTERWCHLCCTQSRSWQVISSFFSVLGAPKTPPSSGTKQQPLCVWLPVWLCVWTAMIHWAHYPGMKMRR